MLKKMQIRVNDQTASLDATRKGRSFTKEQDAELRTLTERQVEVKKLAHNLAEKINGGCKTCGQAH